MTRHRKPRHIPAAERPNLAYCYVRVSTGLQAESGLSLDAQERKVIAAAEAAGFRVEVIRDEGRSGKNITGRPLLADALDRLDAGEAAALYVAKADRLARRLRDTIDIAERAAAHGWALVTMDPAADLSTPMGRAMLQVAGTFAELELETIRERHRTWHAEARQRGRVWGLDYGPRTALPREVVARIVAEREAGRSMRAIADGLTADGIPTARGGKWHPSTVAYVLRSPVADALAHTA